MKKLKKMVSFFSYFLMVFISTHVITMSAARADFQGFLKTSLYGALVGTGVGIVSLAFENRPGENVSNVTRGASLGLYAGIGYAVYESQVVKEETPSTKLYQEFGSAPILVSPQFVKNQVEGIKVQSIVYNF